MGPALSFPPVPPSNVVADHFCGALQAAHCDAQPYRHWLLNEVLPESIAAAILMLPIAPPVVGDCRGVRDLDNSKRTFVTPTLRSQFPVCEVLASALQTRTVAHQIADTLGIVTDEAYLRLEYIQDTDGAWLEPHRDIPEKLFSMVLYLCTGPEASGWGTDIYDSERRWVGRSSAEFNSAVVFVPGADTWHGFEPRPIVGVRRLLEINYVRSDWRDRDQLAFPDRPIVVQPS